MIVHQSIAMPRTRGLRGLGSAAATGRNTANCMSYDEIRAAVGRMTCDSRDAACVACAEQKAAAAEGLYVSGCVVRGSPISFACDTSPTVMGQFFNGQPVAPPITVAGRRWTSQAYTGVSTSSLANPEIIQAPPPAPDRIHRWAWDGLQWVNLDAASPNPPAPAPQPVVNPSPASQPTNAETSLMSPYSALSQANGTTGPADAGTGLLSQVQGYVQSFIDSPDVIGGISNWVLLVAGSVAAVALFSSHKGRGR